MERAFSRLRWALAHKDWTEEDLERLVYSDESTSEEQQPVGQKRWVFSSPGQVRWHADTVDPVKHHQVKLTVWGCFWGKQSRWFR